jgi:hypothetical protein
VDDEVQAALAAEATQLNAVSNQLHARVDATSQQICQLNAVSAALLQHISDKDTTLSLEEKVALMDGRKIAAVPPSPTVLSVSASAARLLLLACWLGCYCVCCGFVGCGCLWCSLDVVIRASMQPAFTLLALCITARALLPTACQQWHRLQLFHSS